MYVSLYYKTLSMTILQLFAAICIKWQRPVVFLLTRHRPLQQVQEGTVEYLAQISSPRLKCLKFNMRATLPNSFRISV